MQKIIKLYSEDIRAIIAEKFQTSFTNVIMEVDTSKRVLEAKIYFENQKYGDADKAYWDYMSGWINNQDKRIEDATCSNCGFKHPIVRGENAPDKLSKACPKCKCLMEKRELI